jgi:hypothetical protein
MQRSKRLILFFAILVFHFWSIYAFGQLTRDWYDVASKMPSGYLYLQNESDFMSWTESYQQHAYLDLFETTRDTVWLDEMVTRIDGMMNSMWDVPPPNIQCNRDVYEDGYLGWGTTHYAPEDIYKEFFVHDGVIQVPIARFIRYVYNDSSLYNKYGSKADTYLSTIESNIIAKWHTNWEGDPGKSGITLEEWGGWDHLPNNQYLIFGAAMIILHDISESFYYSPADSSYPEFYLEQSIEMGNTFKSYLTHQQSEDAYLWGYWSTYPPSEDLTHGYISLWFVLEAYQKGIVFDPTDMQRFANTFTQLIWNGDFEDPLVSRLIDGSSSVNYGEYSWVWTSLAEFDFLVWEIVNAYLEYNFFDTPKKRKESVARLALVAQLYDIYAPGPPTAVVLEPNVNTVDLEWTAPILDEDGTRLTGLAGYNVYRAETPAGPYTKANDSILKSHRYPVVDTTYYYVVTAVDYHIPPNESSYSEVITSIATETSTKLIPESYLSQNYPNPFNAGTVINYSISGNQTQPMILNVYDITGKLVSTLVDENKLPGEYTVRWEGKNLRGLSVASGIYFYKIEAGPFVSMKRMTFLK